LRDQQHNNVYSENTLQYMIAICNENDIHGKITQM